MNRFLNGHSSDDGLVQLAVEDVQKSGLSFENLTAAGVRMFRGDKDDLKEHLGRARINGLSLIGNFRLIEFPYYNEKGEVVLHRYKVVPTTKDHNGKEVKYLHPIGKPAIPYILPSVWGIKDKPNNPIWLSEGEKKSLKIIQHGRCAIGLSGVWNFKSNNPGDEDLFSELKCFTWRGRIVYVAFDADLWTNSNVRQALYELAFKLYERGAIIKITTWTGAKGIDDFLATQDDPDEAIQDIESNSTPLSEFLNPDHRREIIRALTFVEDKIEREILTKAAAKAIGVSVELLRKEISPEENPQSDEFFPHIEPWPDPVNGAELLNEIETAIQRFCILPPYGAETCALWNLHTYTIGASFVTPTLALQSAEMRSGKSTTLSVIVKVCHRPLLASNISPAAVFRSVEKWQPTLIVDEADTFIKDNDELRGILNSGHTRSTAFVIRTVGDTHEPMQFSTWAAKLIALIGKLPATLQDRSIVLRMQRKMPGENVEKLKIGTTFIDIQRKCLRWASDNIEELKKAEPDIPLGLHDRAADNWTPLLSIADLVGGEWTKRARRAAVALSDCHGEDNTAGTMLLADIQIYFKEHETDKVTSTELASYLAKMEERPWPEWSKGKPITPRQIARLLNPFGIIPSTIRIGCETSKGYKKDTFLDAFSRYLLSTPDLSVTTSQSSNDAGFRVFSSVTLQNNVTDKKDSKSNVYAGCAVVTDEKGGEGLTGDNVPFFDEELIDDGTCY